MYAVHVRDLPVLVVWDTRKGQSKKNNFCFYHSYAVTYFIQHICTTLKCDGTPECDGHAKVRWVALKWDGVPRLSAMVHAKIWWYDALKCNDHRWRQIAMVCNAKVRWLTVRCYDPLKCDGHWWNESAMLRRAKVRWSYITRKCDSTPRYFAKVTCDAKVRWFAALKCDGHMVHAKIRPFCFVTGMMSY